MVDDKELLSQSFFWQAHRKVYKVEGFEERSVVKQSTNTDYS